MSDIQQTLMDIQQKLDGSMKEPSSPAEALPEAVRNANTALGAYNLRIANDLDTTNETEYCELLNNLADALLNNPSALRLGQRPNIYLAQRQLNQLEITPEPELPIATEAEIHTFRASLAKAFEKEFGNIEYTGNGSAKTLADSDGKKIATAIKKISIKGTDATSHPAYKPYDMACNKLILLGAKSQEIDDKISTDDYHKAATLADASMLFMDAMLLDEPERNQQALIRIERMAADETLGAVQQAAKQFLMLPELDQTAQELLANHATTPVDNLNNSTEFLNEFIELINAYQELGVPQEHYQNLATAYQDLTARHATMQHGVGHELLPDTLTRGRTEGPNQAPTDLLQTQLTTRDEALTATYEAIDALFAEPENGEPILPTNQHAPVARRVRNAINQATNAAQQRIEERDPDITLDTIVAEATTTGLESLRSQLEDLQLGLEEHHIDAVMAAIAPIGINGGNPLLANAIEAQTTLNAITTAAPELACDETSLPNIREQDHRSTRKALNKAKEATKEDLSRTYNEVKAYREGDKDKKAEISEQFEETEGASAGNLGRAAHASKEAAQAAVTIGEETFHAATSPEAMQVYGRAAMGVGAVIAAAAGLAAMIFGRTSAPEAGR